jgi:hypothetical protein
VGGEEGEIVFVVLWSWCDDRGVKAVCSTRERAERARAMLVEDGGASDEFEIEPWRLDDVLGHEPGPVFRVAIRFDDGSAIPDQRLDWRCLRHPRRAEVERIDESHPMARRNCWPLQIRAESPISSDHAVKVAAEERQAWLKGRPGIDD